MDLNIAIAIYIMPTLMAFQVYFFMLKESYIALFLYAWNLLLWHKIWQKSKHSMSFMNNENASEMLYQFLKLSHENETFFTELTYDPQFIEL